jgi:hypothetical protein
LRVLEKLADGVAVEDLHHTRRILLHSLKEMNNDPQPVSAAIAVLFALSSAYSKSPEGLAIIDTINTATASSAATTAATAATNANATVTKKNEQNHHHQLASDNSGDNDTLVFHQLTAEEKINAIKYADVQEWTAELLTVIHTVLHTALWGAAPGMYL